MQYTELTAAELYAVAVDALNEARESDQLCQATYQGRMSYLTSRFADVQGKPAEQRVVCVTILTLVSATKRRGEQCQFRRVK